MKRLFFIFLIVIYSANVYARVQAGFLYMLLAGKTENSSNSKAFLDNISHSGFGMSFRVDKEIFEHYHIGASLNFADGLIKKEKVENRLLMVYEGDYYNSANSYGSDSWEVVQFGVTLSRTFQTRYIDIEPMVLIGMGNIWSNASFTIDRKKMNDNYNERITIEKKGDNIVFYPSFGVMACKNIYKRWSFNLGVMYNVGSTSYIVNEHKEDFLNKSYPSSEYTFKKPLNAFQATIGLQLIFPPRKH